MILNINLGDINSPGDNLNINPELSAKNQVIMKELYLKDYVEHNGRGHLLQKLNLNCLSKSLNLFILLLGDWHMMKEMVYVHY